MVYVARRKVIRRRRLPYNKRTIPYRRFTRDKSFRSRPSFQVKLRSSRLRSRSRTTYPKRRSSSSYGSHGSFFNIPIMGKDPFRDFEENQPERFASIKGTVERYVGKPLKPNTPFAFYPPLREPSYTPRRAVNQLAGTKVYTSSNTPYRLFKSSPPTYKQANSPMVMGTPSRSPYRPTPARSSMDSDLADMFDMSPPKISRDAVMSARDISGLKRGFSPKKKSEIPSILDSSSALENKINE